MIYYLKTANEAELWAALEAVGLAEKDYDLMDELNTRPSDLAPETEWKPSGAFTWICTATALDIIGTIYKETGNMLTDGNGYEYPETAAIEGFHANLMTKEEVEGLPAVDAPATPYRKWAGM